MSSPVKELISNGDLYTSEYFLIENVCRMCWKINAEIELTFKCSSTNSNNIISLAEKILECLNIDVTHYTHPKKVCRGCCGKIEEFHEFRRFCQETNMKLRDILQRKCDDLPEKKYTLPVSPALVKYENSDNFSIFEDSNSIGSFFDSMKPLDDDKNDKQPVCVKQKKIKKKRPISKQKKVKVKKEYLHKHSPTYCNICCLNLECQKKLSVHNAEYHGIEESGLFKCLGCEKRFKSRKCRTSHEVNFCKGLKDGYKCNICNRYLPKRSTYEFHMRDHRDNKSPELPEDMFKCKKCFKSFKTKEHLNEHMAVHDNIKKNFICDACGRVFMRQDYLHKHMLLHTGTKRHSCPHCDFKATQRSTLTIHIRKHTGERPYSCDMCPQRCISSSNLRAHRKRHLGVKKYECKICNRQFGYKVSLEEHVSSTHERSEMHPCQYCGATYTRVRGLRRHLAAKHGKTENTNSTLRTTTLAEETKLLAKVPAETETNVECNKVDSIINDVRSYELKEGENVLLVKKQADTVYVMNV